jgi:type II secretory ATPase GspE/PulE/Tfp pilus assembly ATPase PilB-like protein
MQQHIQRKLTIGELLRQEGLLTPEQLAQGLAAQKTRRPAVPLGQLCIELGFLSDAELGSVLSKHGQRLLLGEMLTLAGLITPEQLQAALRQQRKPGPMRKQLGALLIENGWLNDKTLIHALSQQAWLTGKALHSLFQKFGALLTNQCLLPQDLLAASVEAHERHRSIETVLMERYQISKQEMGYALSTFYQCPFVEYDDKRQLTPALLLGINPGHLKTHHWVPLQADEQQVDILIDNPLASDKIQDIQRLFPGKTVRCMVGLREDILKYVEAISSDRVQQSTPEALTILLGQMEAAEQEAPLDEVDESTIDENHSVIVRLVNQIISDAYKQGVSDIHIEPEGPKEETIIRFRVDGRCYDYLKVPGFYRRALVSRLKIMARLDIAERRKPQDGKIKLRLADREIELRVATLPTAGDGNEDVVLRILTASKPMPLDQLHITERNLQALRAVLETSCGLILCVGPTGSGKTTTLHAALAALNSRDRKIWTAEDPVEITQRGLRQVQVNAKIGFPFAAALRAFLRADPDIIMVGEIRDRETAEAGLEAALTGHLVLSTLHTNSSVETVTRLLEMGMDPFTFADALLGVMAQRLARTICPHCKESYHPHQDAYNALASGYGIEAFTRLKIPYDKHFVLQRGRGCAECHQTGYKGRIALHEFLVVTPDLRRLIHTRSTAETLLQSAIAQGMTTLVQDGILKVLAGWTDYHQVKAVAMR